MAAVSRDQAFPRRTFLNKRETSQNGGGEGQPRRIQKYGRNILVGEAQMPRYVQEG